MKNIAIGILSIWLLAACDPVVDNKEMVLLVKVN